MAKLVCGVGASHTTLMNTQWDKVNHLERAHAFRNSLFEASERIKNNNTDLAIVVGSNHFRGHWLDMMPTFCIGVGDILASGEHGTPSGPQKAMPEVAMHVCDGLLAREFDVCFSTQMVIDHGISHAIQYLTLEGQIPIVPIMLNAFAPPLPSFQRCLSLGSAIRDIVEQLEDDLNVTVIASGGLSHQLPFPDWRTPQSEDDAFLVDSWKHGRGQWEKYEKRRREIIVNSPPELNQEFDRDFLSQICAGHAREWAESISEEALLSKAGNGANEIRAWLVMLEALNHRNGEVLVYSPMPEWLTGMGVFITH